MTLDAGQESRLNAVARADSRICLFGCMKIASNADQTMNLGHNRVATGESTFSVSPQASAVPTQIEVNT